MTRGQLLVERNAATGAQWSYIRILLNEAFAHHFTTGLDKHHMPTYYTKQQASEDIAYLKAAKARGWR